MTKREAIQAEIRSWQRNEAERLQDWLSEYLEDQAELNPDFMKSIERGKADLKAGPACKVPIANQRESPMTIEIKSVAAAAIRDLPLQTVSLTDDYYYQSLPLCVIDAVYSIGVRYEGVRRVVARYCDKTRQRRVREGRAQLPPQSQQESITEFCGRFETLGLEPMTSDVFANRQRTSARNGILKADAVYRFALILRKFGIEFLQDVPNVTHDAEFETAIRSIQGQRSGVSLQYFWMLTGSDDFIKPDRMVVRFLESTLKSRVNSREALAILRQTANHLSQLYPHITPRLLDYAIWQHQRIQKS